MIESQKTAIPVKYKFFIRMFVATFCAWALPHIAYRLMQLSLGAITLTFTLNSFFLLAFGLAMVSGLGIGLVVSIMQWIALRPYIQSTWRWLVGLILVWIFGDVVNMILLMVTIKAFPDWSNAQSVVFRLIGYSLAIGLPAGLIQQALLKKRTGIRPWWAVAAPLSIFGAIALDRGNLTLRENFAIIDPIYASLLAGLVMAILASLPTLLLKPVEKADQNLSTENPELANSIQTDSLIADSHNN
jgi:hypothetical protein